VDEDSNGWIDWEIFVSLTSLNATRSHTPTWPSVSGCRGRGARNLLSLYRLSLTCGHLSLSLSLSLQVDEDSNGWIDWESFVSLYQR